MFCLCFVALAFRVSAAGCDHSHLLEELYLNNNGVGWIESRGWRSKLPLGLWYGVGVDSGCVVELNLRFNNLTGTLPLGLSQILSLSVLRLSGNQLSGTIPGEYRNLTRLSRLVLDNNLLSGTIPSFLSMLPLTVLQLAANKFTGTLSSQFFQRMPELMTVVMSKNDLSGTFPDMSSNFNLEILLAYSNKFSGPLPFLNCASLSWLDLHDNRFTGTVPDWMGSCKTLNQLFLNTNLFSGTIPSFLSTLPFTVLNLGRNQFTGTLPPQFFQHMDDIIQVLFDNNQLSGTFPAMPSNSKLQILGVVNNKFVGPLPSLDCTSLQFIGLGVNKFTGTIPEWVGTCKALDTLSLEANLLSGTIPNFLSVNLTGLYLGNNSFTGTLSPRFFNQMPELKYLWIGWNNLSGTFPDMSFNSKLEMVLAGSNSFVGPLPLLNCSSLQWIHLDTNRFAGPLPRWMPTCKSLQQLYLANNLLSGTIPSFLSTLPIQELLMGGNQFTGTLSSQFPQQMPDLKILSITNNRLSGAFPDLSSNSKLEQIYAGENGFVGPFPSLNCTLLQNIDLTSNRLTGTVPQWLHTCSQLRILLLSNNSFEGIFPLLKSSTLNALNIADNSFTGDILQLIMGFQNLELFDGSRNKLALSNGDRGVSITHSTLHLLYINDNQFTAKIDSISLSTQQMQFIDLSGNTLYCPLPLSAARIRNSDIFIADQCVTNWMSVLMLALPGILGGLIGLGFLWLFRRKPLLRFLVKVGLNPTSLILNFLALSSFLQLLTPDINFNCEKANSYAVFHLFLNMPPDLNDSTQMTFSTFISQYLPTFRSSNIARFQDLCDKLGGMQETCQYDDTHQECVFNSNSHVQHTQGIQEIIITLMVLLALQQLIAAVLVFLALCRRNKRLTTTQRHVSYPSALVFMLLFSKTTRDIAAEDAAAGLGRRRLMIDFVQGVVLKGALLALNVWVATRVQQTGLSNIEIASSFFNAVNIFIPLVRAMGRCCCKKSNKQQSDNDNLQVPLMTGIN